jgi:hypothetical protein
VPFVAPSRSAFQPRYFASLIPLAPIAEERHAPRRVQGRLLLMTEVYAGIFANL